MNPPASEIGSNLITLLASLMLVLQLLLAVQAMLITNIRIFALQSLLLAVIAGVVGFAYHAGHVYVVARPITSLERLGSNTLAVAIALLLTGFFLMINRRKAITQVLALLTMENGVMLAAIALTTYGMPLVVEIGIFFDVVVAVMVLGILVFRIRETFASMDVSKLNELKW